MRRNDGLIMRLKSVFIEIVHFVSYVTIFWVGIWSTISLVWDNLISIELSLILIMYAILGRDAKNAIY
jgi:hypothetical protein